MLRVILLFCWWWQENNPKFQTDIIAFTRHILKQKIHEIRQKREYYAQKQAERRGIHLQEADQSENLGK